MWLLTSKYVSDDYLYYFMARYSWGKFESSDWLQLGQDFAAGPLSHHKVDHNTNFFTWKPENSK